MNETPLQPAHKCSNLDMIQTTYTMRGVEALLGGPVASRWFAELLPKRAAKQTKQLERVPCCGVMVSTPASGSSVGSGAPRVLKSSKVAAELMHKHPRPTPWSYSHAVKSFFFFFHLGVLEE